jgi:hypothetical protein
MSQMSARMLAAFPSEAETMRMKCLEEKRTYQTQRILMKVVFANPRGMPIANFSMRFLNPVRSVKRVRKNAGNGKRKSSGIASAARKLKSFRAVSAASAGFTAYSWISIFRACLQRRDRDFYASGERPGPPFAGLLWYAQPFQLADSVQVPIGLESLQVSAPEQEHLVSSD